MGARVLATAADTWDVHGRPPWLRSGIVNRPELLNRCSVSDAPIVTVVAPAGFGKTTLLTLWKARETRAVAWLSVDRADDDPMVLLAHIERALWDAGIMPAEIGRVAVPVAAYGAARIVDAVESHGDRGVLMLDQVDTLRSRASRDLIAELAARLRLSGAVTVVLASRTSIRLPAAVYRAQGALLELTADDLAMNRHEGGALLAASGVHVRGAEFDELMNRTEGWPAGLYLVALAAKAGAPRRPALHVGGDDRVLADYLRHELLDHFSDRRVAFLTRTSILDRFCGPLCDAVLDRSGSAATIERLETANLLIVPLDRSRTWYRYHRLLSDFLRAELHRREPPEEVARLDRRASEWFEANDMPEHAIRHAQRCGDADRVAELVGRTARDTYGRGRSATVISWLRWFETDGRATRFPQIAALGAFVHALCGDVAGADRWAGALLIGNAGNGRALPPVGLLQRALLARAGVAQQRADARRARLDDTLDPGWYPAALTLEGFADLWDGDPVRADALFQRAVGAGEWFSGLPVVTMGLAARAMIAIDRGQWDIADEFTAHALKLIRQHSLDRYLTSGLSYVMAARCAVRRGEIAQARWLLAQATALRPLFTTATAGLSVQTLLQAATAHLELADVAGARMVLRDTSDILAKSGDLGVLAGRYDELADLLTTSAAKAVGASALTTAELRLLPFLATHLSFPEIGERLYISRHTVKTQAMSIYRKLGASSRSEAVRRAGDAALLTIR